MSRPQHTRMMRWAAASLTLILLASSGCSRLGGTTKESDTSTNVGSGAGPTLNPTAPPADWQTVSHSSGLIYSVPPDWTINASATVDSPSTQGTDWGSGYVTTANAIAGQGYCRASGSSFRSLTGITAPVAGDAKEQAVSAGRSLADALRTQFTRNGAEVPEVEPRLIGVSGAPAWYVSLRGTPIPPRDSCTPPVMRVDAIAVATKAADQSAATVLFVLISDEQEPGTTPVATIDAVVASLRYDNSI